MLTHYALARHKPRKLKRLYDQLPELMDGHEGVLDAQRDTVERDNEA